MIYTGVELTAAASILGHKDIKTTANIYNRVLNEQKPDTMKALDQFSEKTEKKRENGYHAQCMVFEGLENPVQKD